VLRLHHVRARSALNEMSCAPDSAFGLAARVFPTLRTGGCSYGTRCQTPSSGLLQWQRVEDRTVSPVFSVRCRSP
jgi:hypothetical protein